MKKELSKQEREDVKEIAGLEFELSKVKALLNFEKKELIRYREKYYKAVEEIGALKYRLDLTLRYQTKEKEGE